MLRTPSKYQQDIYQFVCNSLAQTSITNLLISAVAGSGKSTTIKELLQYIPSHMSVMYLTFMREVNLDLGDKVKAALEELRAEGIAPPKAEVRTCHSIGNGCLSAIGIKGDPAANKRKYNHLCQNYLREHMERYNYKLSEQLAELVNKVRVKLSDTTEEDLAYLVAKYSLDIDVSDGDTWPIVVQAVPAILAEGIRQAKGPEHKFDFTDQIWLPSSKALDLQPKTYDVVFVDEAQDLSPCIRELFLKCRKQKSMSVCVGDRKQAIMAFAGASEHSLDELKDATQAYELPLNRCYRCPKSVVRLAQKLVSEIEYYEEAAEGEVEYITHSKVAAAAQIGAMILSRYNAPLVEMAIDLIKARKRCIVKGRDLGGNIVTHLERIAEYYTSRDKKFHPDMLMADFLKFVREYTSHRLAILSIDEEKNEGRINKLTDDTDTLLALYEAHQEEPGHEDTYDDLLSFIKNFFTEHGETKGEIGDNARKNVITLSTGHKAKGLENPDVFILAYDELPSGRAKSQEAIEQENNLLYVMITRAQETLYCVVKEPAEYTAEKNYTMGIVEQELEAPAPVVETTIEEPEPVQAQEVITQVVIEEEKPAKKHAGGRPRKELVRVNIKLDPRWKTLTEDMDRSELINKLLEEYFEGGIF